MSNSIRYEYEELREHVLYEIMDLQTSATVTDADHVFENSLISWIYAEGFQKSNFCFKH